MIISQINFITASSINFLLLLIQLIFIIISPINFFNF